MVDGTQHTRRASGYHHRLARADVLPLLPTGGEGWGEEATFIECPSPRPSPHSCLARRGRRFLVVVPRCDRRPSTLNSSRLLADDNSPASMRSSISGSGIANPRWLPTLPVQYENFAEFDLARLDSGVRHDPLVGCSRASGEL